MKKTIFIIMFLLIGACVIPTINGVNLTSSSVNNLEKGRGVIFSDDFNDNIKDLTKWTETLTNGT